MSAIQVRTPKGNWSKPIQGIDKLHFMREAIIGEYREVYELFGGDYNEAEDAPLGISIDGKDLLVKEETDSREGMQWAISLTAIEEMLSNAKLFEMGENILHQMANEDECLSAFYKKLIEYAEIPPRTEDDDFNGYILMFRFSEEKITYEPNSSEKEKLGFDGENLYILRKR